MLTVTEPRGELYARVSMPGNLSASGKGWSCTEGLEGAMRRAISMKMQLKSNCMEE